MKGRVTENGSGERELVALRIFGKKYLYLFQFKIQSYLQNWGIRVHQNSFRRKTPKFSKIILTNLHFSHQNALNKLPSLDIWNSLLVKPLDKL